MEHLSTHCQFFQAKIIFQVHEFSHMTILIYFHLEVYMDPLIFYHLLFSHQTKQLLMKHREFILFSLLFRIHLMIQNLFQIFLIKAINDPWRLFLPNQFFHKREVTHNPQKLEQLRLPHLQYLTLHLMSFRLQKDSRHLIYPNKMRGLHNFQKIIKQSKFFIQKDSSVVL